MLMSINNEFFNFWNDFEEYYPISWAYNNGEWVLELEMVGVKREDISVEVLSNKLKVVSPKKNYSIIVPKEVDFKTLTAKLDLGLLKVTVKSKTENSFKVEVT